MNEGKKNILFLEPFSGISGDIFLGSLLDLGLEESWLREVLTEIIPEKTQVKVWKDKRGEVSGTRFAVETAEKPKHRDLDDILILLDESGLEGDIIDKSKEMFERLAKTEGKIHGVTKEEVHFHEVGAIDSIADIVGAAAAVSKISPERIFSDPVNVGSGTVSTAHGDLPVPAPATAELLRQGGVPNYSTEARAELTTPTGALILATFVDDFTRPQMIPESIGRGLGSRELEGKTNFLRTTLASSSRASPTPECKGTEILLETNIDDMNPEIFPVVEEKLMEAGASEVFKTPIQMKKNRPGVKLTVICPAELRKKISSILFRETSTLGVRVHEIEREKLERKIKTVKTEFGRVQVKLGYENGELVNIAPEFESCHDLAEKSGEPLKKIYRRALVAAEDSQEIKRSSQ
ncbi:nickel pincer cofactor biosynthesis protein LarC [Candidatus Bipolaricaulota bacterium]|nr:nickel pincer cofactor biosynthesis protein LarC [Candidatus Bipolaricaulota bacterium]